jgi:hypothetical protein
MGVSIIPPKGACMEWRLKPGCWYASEPLNPSTRFLSPLVPRISSPPPLPSAALAPHHIQSEPGGC